MVDKNLFAQDRKPPSPEAAPAVTRSTAPGLSAKAIQLDGVFIHGKTKRALIRYKGAVPGNPRGRAASPFARVEEGEKVGDYVVKKIEPRSISLEKDGQEVVVNLFAEGKIVPPVPPVPVAPVAQTPPANAAPNGQRGAVAPGQPVMRGNRPNELPGAMPPGAGRAPGQPAEQVQTNNQPPQDEGNVAPDEEGQQPEEEAAPEEPAQ